MDGHVPDTPEGDLCRYGFPPSSRHAGILSSAQRKENSDRTTYTMAEPSRWMHDCSRNFSRYQWIPPQITPAQLTRKAATVRNTQVISSGQTPMELAMGRQPRDLLDPASMNAGQLTSTPIKQDVLNEKFKNCLCRLILEYNNERTSAEILLSG